MSTGIEWTDATWNPIVGCSVKSPGCKNCYAMPMAHRLKHMLPEPNHYFGTTKVIKGKPHFTGHVALAPDSILTKPLRWKRPRRIFVNSMGDLFHESVPDAWIDRVFAVMALARQHTLQCLTKRSARMRTWASDPGTPKRVAAAMVKVADLAAAQGIFKARAQAIAAGVKSEPKPITWPLPNVMLGVSAERQQEADERIPDLLATPAAVRFVSAEPLLAPIDFHQCLYPVGEGGVVDTPALSWVIVGGESGKGARPMALEWAASIVEQTRVANVSCFVKQLGACPTLRDNPWPIKHRKGADMAEWPDPLRIREFPT